MWNEGFKKQIERKRKRDGERERERETLRERESHQALCQISMGVYANWLLVRRILGAMLSHIPAFHCISQQNSPKMSQSWGPHLSIQRLFLLEGDLNPESGRPATYQNRKHFVNSDRCTGAPTPHIGWGVGVTPKECAVWGSGPRGAAPLGWYLQQVSLYNMCSPAHTRTQPRRARRTQAPQQCNALRLAGK